MLCLSDENITDSCHNKHYYILNNHAILESEYCVVHSQKSRQYQTNWASTDSHCALALY